MYSPHKHRIAFVLITALLSSTAYAEAPSYDQGRLTIPAVNTPNQVAQYQDVVFEYSPAAGWQLVELDQLGERIGFAHIDEVTPVVTDTFPTQVLLRIAGYAPVACHTEIGKFSNRLDGSHFTITVNTVYTPPIGPPQSCIAAALQFRKTIELPVYGLPSGTYTYDVNGTTGSFELAVDNALAGDCGPSVTCPEL